MKTRWCTSLSAQNPKNEERKSETIPLDLIFEILLKKSSKFIARFRCVSKQWDSTLASPAFTEPFFKVSSSRRKLLLACLKDNETFFFSSSPKPPGSSSPLSVDFHMSFPFNNGCESARPVRGLVCGLNQSVTVPLICNPSTGQTLSLPTLKTTKMEVKTFLLYDPVGKQFKVLCQYWSRAENPWLHEHQVLTLAGTQEKKLSWRIIDCDVKHVPLFVIRPEYQGICICINGVLYYLGYVLHDGDCHPVVICFDVRSERFKCIRHPPDMRNNFMTRYMKSTLVNYKGKLAMLQPDLVDYGTECTDIQLWVLQDGDNSQLWSSFTYAFTPLCSEISAETKLRVVGMTETGEIVMSPDKITDSFYLVYYNTENKTVTRVAIQATNDVLQIFGMNAIGQESPEDGFEELASEVTYLAGRKQSVPEPGHRQTIEEKFVNLLTYDAVEEYLPSPTINSTIVTH